MKIKTKILESRLKAFTLIEVLIVFVISSTVILLAMWAYMNVFSYLRSYNKNEGLNQELAIFLNFANNDIDRAKQIIDNRDALLLEFNNQKPISYEFYNDFVVREQYGYQDTFMVKINSYFFEYEKINNDWVSEITIEALVSGVVYPITYYKHYSNKQLFEAYEY